MEGLGPQKVGMILGELQEDDDYLAFTSPALDEHLHRFRQGVEITQIRCFTFAPEEPTVAEIEDRLDELHMATVGTLARLRPFIERAQAALRAG